MYHRVHSRMSMVHVWRWDASGRKWLRIRLISRMRVLMLCRLFVRTLWHRTRMHMLATKRISCRALAGNLHHAVEGRRRREGQSIRHCFSMMRANVSMTVRMGRGPIEGKRIGSSHVCGSFPKCGDQMLRETMRRSNISEGPERWFYCILLPNPSREPTTYGIG